MINIDVIAVGKLKEKFLQDGCAEYFKRLGAYAKVNIVEIKEERISDNPSEKEISNVIEKEGERILSKIKKDSFVVPLCIEGIEFDSPSFSKEIASATLKGFNNIVFVIGGSYGLSDRVKRLGKVKLSFGKMTLPHQLARLVLLEQIYRAFQIMNNGKYHK